VLRKGEQYQFTSVSTILQLIFATVMMVWCFFSFFHIITTTTKTIFLGLFTGLFSAFIYRFHCKWSIDIDKLTVALGISIGGAGSLAAHLPSL
jgi:membrane protein YdbS with pleckstrin-like domain